MGELKHINVLSQEISAASGNGHSGSLQGAEHVPQTLWERILPHGRLMRMTQEAKGVFIPYPLLGIIITLCTIVVAGIIAIQVQVSNLSTTILLRDADQRAQIESLKEKTEQLQVYIYDSREKQVKDRAEIEYLKDKRR
jgi:hypothetical protein